MSRSAPYPSVPSRPLRRSRARAFFAVLATFAVAASATWPRTARALPSEVEAALARARVPREALVVWVAEVGSRRPRLAWQADKPVNPASLFKIVTTFAGLELLGPGFAWSTPVWLRGPVEAGVLQGDVVIRGSGDPKLVVERMWLLLRRLQQAGVREIRGDIVLDRTAFSPGAIDPGEFDGEPLRPYNANADALLLNFGAVVLTLMPEPSRGVATVAVDPPLAGVRADATVALTAGPCADWRGALQGDFTDPTRLALRGVYPVACGEKTWAIAYADPKRYQERALVGMWHELGGKLTGTVRDGVAPTSTPSFELRSPALPEIVRDINKLSNNVMAQQLFLTLGATQRNAGTPEASRAVLVQFLRDTIGGAAAGSVVVNGSGLSREGRLPAIALGRLLQAAWASPVMSELMSSLPVSGVDGTLRRARAAPGRAHLKTGSLRDTAGIAGYVLGDSGRRYVVVAIVNHASAGAARPALEALVGWVASDGNEPPPTRP